MNEQQYQRLSQLADEVFEYVMQDADPRNWCASGIVINNMTQDQRGDAQWSRKIAASTLSIYSRLDHVLNQNFGLGQQGVEPQGESEAKELDEELRAAEKEAMRLINRSKGDPRMLRRRQSQMNDDAE